MEVDGEGERTPCQPISSSTPPGGDRVELMLAFGASRREASRDAVARATRLALTPILNQLSVVGLVWIPGMMTGQMIAGSDPAQVRERGGIGGSKWHWQRRRLTPRS